jgi:hypothetical protein
MIDWQVREILLFTTIISIHVQAGWNLRFVFGGQNSKKSHLWCQKLNFIGILNFLWGDHLSLGTKAQRGSAPLYASIMAQFDKPHEKHGTVAHGTVAILFLI